jgi:hypothetical protein
MRERVATNIIHDLMNDYIYIYINLPIYMDVRIERCAPSASKIREQEKACGYRNKKQKKKKKKRISLSLIGWRWDANSIA